jgi:hypothetical protein
MVGAMQVLRPPAQGSNRRWTMQARAATGHLVRTRG